MNQFSKLQKEQIRAVAEPIWRNIIEAAREDFPLLTTIEPDFEFIDSLHRENSITILWRLSSSRYQGEFLGLLTLQSGDNGMEIVAVSVN